MSNPRTQQNEDERTETSRAELLATLIAAAVLRELGPPTGLLRVAVVKLWTNHYRVNVLTGSAADSRVAHSYFLTADDGGRVLAASPAITRSY